MDGWTTERMARVANTSLDTFFTPSLRPEDLPPVTSLGPSHSPTVTSSSYPFDSILGSLSLTRQGRFIAVTCPYWDMGDL